MPQCLGYLSLAILVIQTTSLVLIIRYSRTSAESGPRYLPSTVVVIVEFCKVLVSSLAILCAKGGNFVAFFSAINVDICRRPIDTLKLALPSGLYTVQNNLLYIALNNLNVVTYQATYQLKILTTAIFSVLILGRKLNGHQWLALVFLIFGVSLVQLQKSSSGILSASNNQKEVVGLVAVIAASFSSGFSGVYLEKILKETHQSLWIRNIQLGIFGIFLSLTGVVANDIQAIRQNGFFQGYNFMTWIIIALQSLGGILVAAVMKYADNILKGFALSISIVLSSIVSFTFFEEMETSRWFFPGIFIVILSTALYEYKPTIVVNVHNINIDGTEEKNPLLINAEKDPNGIIISK